MTHYQMDSEGRNGVHEVTYALHKDNELISFGEGYSKTLAIVLAQAADDDTFSDYPDGDPRWTVAQVKAWKEEQKQRIAQMSKGKEQ